MSAQQAETVEFKVVHKRSSNQGMFLDNFCKHCTYYVVLSCVQVGDWKDHLTVATECSIPTPLTQMKPTQQEKELHCINKK